MALLLTPSLLALSLVLAPAPTAAQAQGDPGTVLARIRLDDLREPFERTLGERDEFASGLASLGDINGDGTTEFAIGAPGDFSQRGAVWIFSLTNDRRIGRYVKLGPIERLPFALDEGDRFGTAVTALADLDGDGRRELAVGAPGDDDGLSPPFGGSGAVYVLFLRGDGTIREHVKLSRTSVFEGVLDAGDSFGTAVALLGDLDGNGVPDLAVGAPGDDDGANGSGAVWILFFAADRSILRTQKLSQLAGGLTGLSVNGRFGSALALVGDLSNDGAPELAVGAPRARADNGDCHVLGLRPDGTVQNQHLLQGSGHAEYGGALAALGDLDGDGFEDLAIGATDGGSVHLTRLGASGQALNVVVLATASIALAAPGDRNGDGRPDLFIGTRNDLIGGFQVHDLNPNGTSAGSVSFSAANMGLALAPRPAEEYGMGVAPLGDLDGNGLAEVAVSAPFDGNGALWVHFLTGTAGTRVQKSAAPAGLQAMGRSLARLGDLDRDGNPDLAATARSGRDAIAILFLNGVGRIARHRTILDSELPGSEVSQLNSAGDFDGDGNSDLLVRSGIGLVYLLYLEADGGPRATKVIDLTLVSPFDRNRIEDAFLLGREARSGQVGLMLMMTDRQYLLRLDADGNVLSAAPRVVPFRNLVDGVGLGDLDGDGLNDFARLDRAQRRMRIELLDALGQARGEELFGSGRAVSVGALGDLSGDGVPDLAAMVTPGDQAPSHVILFQLGGTATGGFEHQDNPQETPLENGRAYPRPHPGRTFVISSGGANLGAAVFDSTLGGPNDPSQDPDLLVGSGKVLMLQNSLHGTQTLPGIFDVPDDDRDGGLLAFDFPRLVRPLSLELIDIDPGSAVTSVVTLRDDAGRTRVYDVPPGFTEDRVNDGGSGIRVLRLDTLVPQVGFRTTATAAEMPGFRPERVVRIEVDLGGSGALDDLTWDPYP